MFVKYFLLLMICLLGLQLLGQEATYLPETIIESDKLNEFAIGSKLQKIDSTLLSTYANTQLSALLADQSSIFIKNYGPSNIVSMSMRGTNASETAVLWNGINIQSSMLGQSDLSLLPTNFADNITIQSGSAGALYGSGAIGGAIHINNASKYNTKLQANIGGSWGSFTNYQPNVGVSYGGKNYYSGVKFFYKNALNNFPIEYNNKQYLQPNAQLIQKGFLQENHYKLNAKNSINLIVWYQESLRELPPTLEQKQSLATQEDASWKVSSTWTRSGNKLQWNVKNALITEELNYYEFIKSESRAISYINQIESTLKISNSQLVSIGNNFTTKSAKSSNYIAIPSITRNSLYANYKIQNTYKTWAGNLGVRKEWIANMSDAPLCPYLGFEGKIINAIKLTGNVARNYRVPTFNDLYWYEASAIGNPALKPQNGWSTDLGLVVKPFFTNGITSTDLTFSINYFNNYIYNQINWKPRTDGRWSPENISEVWTRGIETETNLIHYLKTVKVKWTVATNYTLATKEKTAIATDASYKMQLIYVPIYNLRAKIELSWRKWNLNYLHNYIGYRYTTSDNSAALSPYFVGNVQLNKGLEISKTVSNIFVQLNNIWDARYQVVQYYAMPGFNYQLGINIQFNK